MDMDMDTGEIEIEIGFLRAFNHCSGFVHPVVVVGRGTDARCGLAPITLLTVSTLDIDAYRQHRRRCQWGWGWGRGAMHSDRFPSIRPQA